MQSPHRRARAIVTGHVQGVSYRAATAEQARRLGLTGWVKNRSDGAVEVEVEGPAHLVSDLLAWCEHGPPSAQVARVAIEDLVPSAAERAFEIRR
jgi:acylphosphatase